MDNTMERLTEILRNGILAAMDDDNRYLYTDVVDYMMAHGVTIATDNNVGDKSSPTNADRIRAMSDEELKYIARAVIKAEDCPMGDTECTDCVFHDLCLRGNYYYYNEEEWLQQPAE